jgi:hypothetical protein
MRWFSRKVQVTLIDDATGAVFGVTKMPPEDMPESFALETTLHLGDADWSAVQAEPRTRAEYSRSGALTLRLRRIEKIDPRDLLFSLPSICDRLPALGSGPLAGDECLLAEDDWRQVELVSRVFAAECDAEIAAIRRIHEQASVGLGWREIHVRKLPDPPISAPLTLADLDRAFGGVTLRGVAFHGAGAPIASGFSFKTADGLECYGVAEDGRVSVLGIVQDVPTAPPTRSVDALAGIAREFDLDLVHWCRNARLSWGDPWFRHLLLGRDG